MSATVHLSRTDSEDHFRLSIGESSIQLTELRIQDNSNFKYPHRVLGRGGASIAIDDYQLMQLVAEWLRFTVMNSAEYKQSDCASSFAFKVERVAGTVSK